MKKIDKFMLFILPIISAVLCAIAAVGNFYIGNLGIGISMIALTVMDILLYKGNRRLYK